MSLGEDWAVSSIRTPATLPNQLTLPGGMHWVLLVLRLPLAKLDENLIPKVYKVQNTPSPLNKQLASPTPCKTLLETLPEGIQGLFTQSTMAKKKDQNSFGRVHVLGVPFYYGNRNAI